MKSLSFLVFVNATLLIFGCENVIALNNDSFGENVTDTTKGLKDYYKDFFPIGVSVSPLSLTGSESELILKHFGSLTADNVMKPAPIHPEENRYFWDSADKIVNYAQEHGMLIRGHILCWHQQLPAWMFKDANGNTVTKEIALARFKIHINQIVTRYKGKVYAWDVVNEAVDDDAFTPEMEQKQIQQYKMIFKVLRDYKNVIIGVTFWNISDKRSWFDNFPVRGRKNYPLLFDQNLQPKKAYWEVVKF